MPVPARVKQDWHVRKSVSVGEPKAGSRRKRRYSVRAADIVFPGANRPPWKTLREGIKRGRRREARRKQPRSEKARAEQFLRQEARRNKRLLDVLKRAGVL